MCQIEDKAARQRLALLFDLPENIFFKYQEKYIKFLLVPDHMLPLIKKNRELLDRVREEAFENKVNPEVIGSIEHIVLVKNNYNYFSVARCNTLSNEGINPEPVYMPLIPKKREKTDVQS